jgi:dihydrofolate reductase
MQEIPTMRRLRYCIATSLDGFIAGPNGEYDWIVPDPGIDFAAHWAQFDTVLMGRKTYQVANARRAALSGGGQRWVVVSSTLEPAAHPDVEILSENVAVAVAALKTRTSPNQGGKDIWLFGGGELFRFLLDAGLVDTVEVTIIPVLLGSGTPLLREGKRQSLKLQESKTLPSGILVMKYLV